MLWLCFFCLWVQMLKPKDMCNYIFSFSKPTSAKSYLFINSSSHHSQLGHTALLSAAHKGHAEVVQLLLNGGANIHERNNKVSVVCFEYSSVALYLL